MPEPFLNDLERHPGLQQQRGARVPKTVRADRRYSSARSYLPTHAGDVLRMVRPSVRMDENEPRFLPRLSPEEPLLLAVGRLEPVKGHDLLLEALAG